MSAGGPTEPGPPTPSTSTSRTRPTPIPWIDCGGCGWRHYPAMTRSGWRMAKVCTSCGATLPELPVAVADGTAKRQL